MGANPAPVREGSAQAAGFLLDERPDIGCERPELLNGLQLWLIASSDGVGRGP